MDEYTFFKQPELSRYTLIFSDISYTPTKEAEPNAFHRFMQELCFGVKWEKK
jgi:hypothetical protein